MNRGWEAPESHTKQVSLMSHYYYMLKLDVSNYFILIFNFFTTYKNVKGKIAPSSHSQSTKESSKKILI